MFFDPILVLARPKDGVFIHYGVQLGDGTVYDYVPGVNLRRTNREGFADGQEVTEVASIPWQQAHIVRARLAELERNPKIFNKLTFNCEHFVNWLISGEAKSLQVAVLLGLLGIGLLAAFAAAR